MIQFNIGDRVRLVDAQWGNARRGDAGTVVGEDPMGFRDYAVDFDCNRGNAHYVDAEQIELVPAQGKKP